METISPSQPTNYTHIQPSPEDVAKALESAKLENLVGSGNAIPIAQPAPANAQQTGDHPHHHTMRAIIKITLALIGLAAIIYFIFKYMNQPLQF